jgi:RNA polymerase sigma-70 factor (ECF subfamily)
LVARTVSDDEVPRVIGERRRRASAAADEALVRSLYAEHGRALLAYTTRLTGDRAAAEDVVQETLVKAWRNPDVLVNERGSVRGWLFTVARNLVIDRARARAARPLEVAETATPAPAPGDLASQVVDSVVVMDAMDRLTPEQRSVITEIYFRGSTVAQAAASLDIPPGTVKSRSFYALRALRDAIESPALREREVAG